MPEPITTADESVPSVTLRRLPEVPTDADYAACIEVHNRNHPDHPRTVEEIKERDQNREARHFNVRFLAEQKGKPVGLSAAGHSAWHFHPNRFWISVEVVPEVRKQGIGTMLYNALLDGFAPGEPIKLMCHAREDRPDSLRFAEIRGFVEQMREFESRLDVTNFDPTPFADRRDIPARNGIEILMLRDLQGEPGWLHNLYELEKETSEDVPDPDPFSFPSEEEFTRLVLENSGFLPEAYAIARDRATGEWAGSSGVWKRKADNWLETGLTGVKRAHRRKGIAFAMKLQVIDYAKSVGCPVITTDNATTNRAMLSINEALGYVKEPAWIMLGHYPRGQQDVNL